MREMMNERRRRREKGGGQGLNGRHLCSSESMSGPSHSGSVPSRDWTSVL